MMRDSRVWIQEVARGNRCDNCVGNAFQTYCDGMLHALFSPLNSATAGSLTPFIDQLIHPWTVRNVCANACMAIS